MGVKHSLIVLDETYNSVFDINLGSLRISGVLGRDLGRSMLMTGVKAPALNTLRRFGWSIFFLKDAPDIMCLLRTD